VQPHTLGVPPPPQLSGSSQVPHSSVAPQPSLCTPQATPSVAHDVGVQAFTPHLFCQPPPQISPSGHVPHATVSPQPFGAMPHSAWSFSQLVGMQPPLSTPPSASAPESKGSPHEVIASPATTSDSPQSKAGRNPTIVR